MRKSALKNVAVGLLASLAAMGAAHAQSRVGPPVLGIVPSAVAPSQVSNTPNLQMAPSIVVSDALTVSGQKASLKAIMQRGVAPVNGASLQFKIDSATVGQGVTDASGKAEVPYLPIDGLAVGDHTISVFWHGDGKTPAANASAKLKVMKSITKLDITPTWENDFIRIKGTLNGASNGDWLGSRDVTLQASGVVVGKTKTDKWGEFGFFYKPNEGTVYLVAFEGDAGYVGTTKKPTFNTPQGGGPNININLNLPH